MPDGTDQPGGGAGPGRDLPISLRDATHQAGAAKDAGAGTPAASVAVKHGQLVADLLNTLKPIVGNDPHVLAGIATAYIAHVLPILG